MTRSYREPALLFPLSFEFKGSLRNTCLKCRNPVYREKNPAKFASRLTCRHCRPRKGPRIKTRAEKRGTYIRRYID